MNEARVMNFALIGTFIIMLCVYLFTVHMVHVNNFSNITTTVSAICG